jgi:predicted DCC family thiol-disulfide oxidoreductase YuxK
MTTLPDPARNPILLYDGVCNLCDWSVQFVLKRDRPGRFRFAPLQSDVGQALAERYGFDVSAVDTIVLLDADGVHERSDAGLRTVRHLGAPWSWLWPLHWLPRFVRDAAYGFVASHRYAWFGRSDECLLPRPEWRERFLA